MRNQKGFMQIILVLVVIALIGGAYYFGKVSNKSKAQKLPTPTPESSETSVKEETANWKTYTNNEIGFSFMYPNDYGNFNIDISNGETGKRYTGGFSNNKYLLIGGISKDYTAGRSGTFYDFVKYIYESGKYYHLMALDKKFLIEPIKILNVNNQKVLIVNSNSYVDERGVEGPAINPGAENIGALINIPNGIVFSGIAVRNLDTKSLPEDKFDQILSTFKFTK